MAQNMRVFSAQIQINPTAVCISAEHLLQTLTLSQTTNFRLFQTERVCRRQKTVLQKRKNKGLFGKELKKLATTCALQE